MSTVTAFRYHTEVIDGIEREKPLPKRLHITIQKRIAALLASQYSDPLIMPELDIRMGNGDYIVPDVVVTLPDAAYDNDMLDGPQEASLCVEIMSPGQTLSEMVSKCERLIAGGCPMCWLIWPAKRLAYTFSENGGLETEPNTLRGGPFLDKVRVSVVELFKDLPDCSHETVVPVL